MVRGRSQSASSVSDFLRKKGNAGGKRKTHKKGKGNRHYNNKTRSKNISKGKSKGKGKTKNNGKNRGKNNKTHKKRSTK